MVAAPRAVGKFNNPDRCDPGFAFGMKVSSIHTFMIVFFVLFFLLFFIVVGKAIFRGSSGAVNRQGTSNDLISDDSPMHYAGSNDNWPANNDAAVSVSSFDSSPSSFESSPSSFDSSPSVDSSSSGGGSSDGGGASGSW